MRSGQSTSLFFRPTQTGFNSLDAERSVGLTTTFHNTASIISSRPRPASFSLAPKTRHDTPDHMLSPWTSPRQGTRIFPRGWICLFPACSSADSTAARLPKTRSSKPETVTSGLGLSTSVAQDHAIAEEGINNAAATYTTRQASSHTIRRAGVDLTNSLGWPEPHTTSRGASPAAASSLSRQAPLGLALLANRGIPRSTRIESALASLLRRPRQLLLPALHGRPPRASRPVDRGPDPRCPG
ncbi:hypothetical protein G6O67_008485 [Ophiocordyceps sinensis]|uniref:Uncharacterized protein n=1 Tax=Ophiocordyceps sinensis TaxID=72228 RepID=A0A8H4LSY2_9HYPO|nr:hypothetical protein G6O67_008485 [Ophiocordyceps sinensis]